MFLGMLLLLPGTNLPVFDTQEQKAVASHCMATRVEPFRSLTCRSLSEHLVYFLPATFVFVTDEALHSSHQRSEVRRVPVTPRRATQRIFAHGRRGSPDVRG